MPCPWCGPILYFGVGCTWQPQAMEKVVITTTNINESFLPEQSTYNSCLQLPGLVEINSRN